MKHKKRAIPPLPKGAGDKYGKLLAGVIPKDSSS
jgi:hypothetical protein